MADAKDLRDQAYMSIKKMMIDGELLPGKIYTTIEIAERLGMSRTPAREALICLHVEGYLKEIKKMGFLFPEVSLAELRKISESMLCIELYALSQIRTHQAELDFEKMEAIIRQQKEKIREKDSKGYLERCCQFHQEFIELLENDLFNRIGKILSFRIRVAGTANRRTELMETITDECERLLRTLKAQDYNTAEEIIRAYYRSVLF